MTQDARGGGNIATADAGGAHLHEGNTRLLPWLILCAVLAGTGVGLSVGAIVIVGHGEDTLRVENDRQYRFIQEFRVRVEDAENAVEKAGLGPLPNRPTKEH